MKMTRHMWLAVPIAVVLGFASYHLAGVFLADKQIPEGAEKPVIPIVLTSKCQLSTMTSCEGLSDDDRLQVTFSLLEENNDLTFTFKANRPLEDAVIQVTENIPPYVLDNRGAGQWQIKLDIAFKDKLKQLNFVAQHEKATYFAELPY